MTKTGHFKYKVYRNCLACSGGKVFWFPWLKVGKCINKNCGHRYINEKGKAELEKAQ